MKNTKFTNKKPTSNLEPMVTDFGTRAISSQNFSRIVALPKTALTNCGINITRVNVQLVQDKEERYIKLTPLSEEEMEEET